MTEFLLLLPEIFLAITLAFVVVSEIAYHGEKIRLLTFISLGGLAGALIQTLISYGNGPFPVFGTAMVVDGLSLFFKIFFILLAGFSIVGSRYSKEIRSDQRAEYCALVIGSCLAACVAASAADALLAFLSLQTLNILAYFLAAFSKKSVRSTEAAVKHLVFGAVSGGMFLFAVAILFASTQTINIYEMHKILVVHPLNRDTGLVVFMLMFLSLAFQMAAFPMSLWAPDVSQGSPTPVSSFVTIGSRAAGVAISLRFLLTLFAQPSGQPGQWQVLGSVDWTHIVALISGLTMVYGSLLAFRQTTAKRLVAYLAVADSGFLLLGLLVLDQVGIAALLYHLVVQLFALMGAYFVLSLIFDELGSDDLTRLKGMLARGVPECVCLILFLACLVGLPPLPGFIGKFALIGAAIRHEWYLLAAIAIGSSAIAAIGVARLCFGLMGDLRNVVQSPAASSSTSSRRAFLAALLLPLLLVGVFAELILQWAGQSLRFILW